MFLVGGAVLPYVLSGKSAVREAITSPLKMVSGEAAPQAPQAAHGAAQAAGATIGGAAHPAASGTKPAASTSQEKFVDLEQAFRWEITPAWILGNWPRVTTHLAALDSQGYRVTLITGTTQTDVAGAVTYYFDPQQRLQKMVFNGTTGDAKRLVQFLIARHHFERRFTPDPSVYLYQVEQDGQALSDLKIKTAPIVRTTSAYSRFEVSLTMNRPAE
ncbi:MAG: hypothetical protein C0483_20005 [Pirellula sp.]|nr:hypothetical protein [Pirellula sp.]